MDGFALNWPSIIVALLGSGGVAALVAFKKLPAERDSIIVTAAEGVVLIQGRLLTDLREQVSELERRQAEQAAASAAALAECQRERDELRSERDELRSRLGAVEAEVADLRRAQTSRPPQARTRRTDRGR